MLSLLFISAFVALNPLVVSWNAVEFSSIQAYTSLAMLFRLDLSLKQTITVTTITIPSTNNSASIRRSVLTRALILVGQQLLFVLLVLVLLLL